METSSNTVPTVGPWDYFPYPAKNSKHAQTSSMFLSNVPVLNIAAHARLYDRSLTSLIGEKTNKLINGCSCLYTNGGVLMGIPPLRGNPMHSITKDRDNIVDCLVQLTDCWGDIWKTQMIPPTQ